MNTEMKREPPRPKYGEHTYEDRAEIAVRVTAVDFNGTSFDGSPFSTTPDWLMEAIKVGNIVPNMRRHTDYADWDVVTEEGTVTVTPGDWIIRREKGDLSTVNEKDAFILINLRPPVSGDKERS